jgi:hypothetical protein
VGTFYSRKPLIGHSERSEESLLTQDRNRIRFSTYPKSTPPFHLCTRDTQKSFRFDRGRGAAAVRAEKLLQLHSSPVPLLSTIPIICHSERSEESLLAKDRNRICSPSNPVQFLHFISYQGHQKSFRFDRERGAAAVRAEKLLRRIYGTKPHSICQKRSIHHRGGLQTLP